MSQADNCGDSIVCQQHFRRLDERLADVQAGIAEIRVIYQAQQARLERMEKTLYGNGAPGLCTKISAVLWISAGVAGFLGVFLAQSISSLVGQWLRG